MTPACHLCGATPARRSVLSVCGGPWHCTDPHNCLLDQHANRKATP